MQKRAETRNFRLGRQSFTELLSGGESLKASVWPVAARYKCVAGWIYPEGKWDLTFPLDDPDLFLSFARLGINPSEKSICRWAERRGILFRNGSGQQSANGSLYEQDLNGSLIANQDPMKLSDFASEACRARDLLELYTQLQSLNVDAIDARVENPQTEIDERLSIQPRCSDLSEEIQKAYGGLRELEDKHKLWTATGVLSEELTRATSGIKMGVELRDIINGLSYVSPFGFEGERDPLFKPPYSLKSTWYCSDLLSAIYLQFSLLVTQHKPLRRCENPACNLPFPITRKNKRHCNDTCRSNARNYK